MLTFDQIKELIDLIGERQLGGLELERSGFRLKIDGGRPQPGLDSPSVMPATVATVEAAVDPLPPAGGDDAGPAVDASEHHVLNSPIVGTFYSAPSPEADAYVQVGDRVSQGQVLCIIEAMKLMNEIEADVDGVLVAVHPKNAQPVEFGEPLFSIRP